MHLAEFLVGVLLVGGAWSAPAVLTPADIRDLASVIPLERVWKVVSDYLVYDKDVNNLLGYVSTDDFKNMITKIDNIPEFIEFLDSLEESSFPAYKYWNLIHTVLGLPSVDNMAATPKLTGGVAGLVSDVRALLMEGDIKILYEAKLKSNPRLRALVEHFDGQKFKVVLGKVAALPEVSTIIEKLGLSDMD